MTEEQLRASALKDLEDGVYLSVFTYFINQDKSIHGSCGEGTCDMDYDDFEQWWKYNKKEYIEMYINNRD